MTVRSMIERVPVDAGLGRRISEWKALRAEGWDVAAAVARDRTHVVLLACRPA